ncbi:hypothetical protein OAA15_00270 [bacterium]|nr:hypothetical protein [bacterium]
MSVFDQSFDSKVVNQLKIREQILSVVSGDDGILSSRPKGYIQYANNKTPFIRLQSGVDITDPNLKNYFNIKKDSDLAKRFILDGGTQLTAEGTGGNLLSAQRSNFIGKGGKYGAPELGGTSDLGIRPMPGVNSMSLKSYGENISTLRIASVSITCYDIHQLEALEVLYMRPGYQVLLEWGHTIYFDDLIGRNDTPKQTLQNVDVLTQSPDKKVIYDNIINNRDTSACNYDAMIAKIRNYSWESLPDGSYRCTIELISLGDIIDSLKISVPSVSEKTDGTNEAEKNQAEEASNAFLGILDTISSKITKSIVPGIELNFQKDIDSKLSDSVFKTYRIGGGENIQPYIRLQDFVQLINETCIYFIGTEQSIYLEYKSMGKCLSHIYQLSSNPSKVLIAPYDINGLVYGGDDDPINGDLQSLFPYRSKKIASPSTPKTSGDDQYSGNMEEILLNINFLKETFKGLINDENKNDVFLKDYFNRILSALNLTMGSINDFHLVRTDRDDTFEIIDLNYRNTGKVGDNNYYTIPVMGIGNGDNKKGSYVRDYRLSTSLTNDIATTISIQAQAGPQNGIDGYNTSVFNAFNVGISDRLSQPIKSSFNGKQTDESTLNKWNINILINNIITYLKKINKFEFQLSDDESRALSSDMRDLVNYTNHLNPIHNLNFGTYTPIPLNLSITLDGVSGIKVGNIFRLPADRLPRQYKVMNEDLYGKGTFGKPRVAFIVFGIDQNVDQAGWITTLDCQMVLLKPQSKTPLNSLVNDPVKENIENKSLKLTEEEILGIQQSIGQQTTTQF